MTDPVDRLKAALADRYPIERELGRGGMATVYLAQDIKHGRRVAIKVLRPELAAMLGAERFLREIEIAARLSHPHILPLYDSGQVDGLLFYVMPHIEGESLRDRLDREKQLPIDEAVRLAQQVASALDYAHRREIVHRDIKPENILLHEGLALVADFGIALAVRAAAGERLTEAGLSLGTPYYMSPEQAIGDRPIDARSDIYSLGCVLYEMLAGEPPFTGSTVQAVVARILTEQPRELRSVRENVSVALERVVAKSLARLPADRYATVAKFSEALDRAGAEPWGAPTAVIGTASGATAAPLAAPPRRSVFARLAPALVRSAPWIVAVLALGLAGWGWLGPHLAQVGQDAAEVSTEEFQRILAEDQVVVLDTRPHLEYSISHIPGARNVAARPGVPMSIYVSDVAEVSRLVGGDMNRTIVLYCNGPFCLKSKRLGDELVIAGHKNIRRYQLGIPVWRAFGGVTVIEADGLRHVLALDRTAVVIDVRDADAYRDGTLPGARNVPRNGVLEGRDVGEIRLAKDDGRLPMQDHNTRIIVIGRTAGDARFVAQALTYEAFHNVAYFPGTFEEAKAALAR
ncbi:MAG: protein kinase [Gemmatimonadaceae bacterium]|nr:protein kinase [Gemmatimonadaceae bacterium]